MRAILVDFDTEPGRAFEDVRPIGVLVEREGGSGFESLYLEAVTEEGDSGHDNYVRTMAQTQEFRDRWDLGEDVGAPVSTYFEYLAESGYLGLRLRTLGFLDDGVTLQEAFDQYVVRAEPLVASDREITSEA